MKTWIKRKFNTFIEKLAGITSKPGPVCLGFALGVFLGTTPFVGLKAFIAIGLTWLFRWNKVASIIGVFQFNVVTGPIFYGASFVVGRMLLGSNVTLPADVMTLSGILQLLTGNLWVFMSLLVGGIALGVPMAVFSFFCAWYLIKWTRNRRQKGPEEPEGEPVYTLITGASSGLGKELAIACAREKRNLLLVALPGQNLIFLCRRLEMEYGILAQGFEMDLTDRKVIERFAERILGRYRVNFLINNAGTGGTQLFEDSTVDYLDRIILLNIRAVAILTRLMIPELKKHPESRIMNISSMAAFSPIPFKTVYPASKAFVSSFSRSLNIELKGTGVKVIAVHPGPIMTNPDVTRRILSQGSAGKLGLLMGAEIAKISLKAFGGNRTVVVPGLGNKFCLFLIRFVPEVVRMRVLVKVFLREAEGQQRAAA
jgi:short-subunit dehydrogenase/uncharacterized protein (DUF2062 family)